MSLIFFGSISRFVDLFQRHDVEVKTGLEGIFVMHSKSYKVRSLHDTALACTCHTTPPACKYL